MYKTFSDYLIKPQYSEIESRSSVDTSYTLSNANNNSLKIKLDIPVISSNMKTVTGSKMAIEIYKRGGIGILHRFSYLNSFDYKDILNENLEEFNNVKNSGAECGVSIGVQDYDKERFEKFYKAGAKIFCLDVAHGHHIKVKKMLEFMNSAFISETRHNFILIAGNVATSQAAIDLHFWGADYIKVGIGGGFGCLTRKNTGVGLPQLDCLKEIRENGIDNLKLISDGGIRTVGDICKALKYSDLVMLGSFLSGTSETPGNVYKNNKDEYYKVYGGSASGESKGQNKFVEGVMHTIPFKGKVKYILREIKQGIQSACSYVNANNLEEFKKNCELVSISGGSNKESFSR
jgi:IMP dehydrogenase